MGENLLHSFSWITPLRLLNSQFPILNSPYVGVTAGGRSIWIGTPGFGVFKFSPKCLRPYTQIFILNSQFSLKPESGDAIA
ncbi:MAG: hypothetical protein F6K31_11090 [Symploca sp. SIO2G7]|nr:hypothetical protein [Symploca sp. SIO2G7]